MDSIQVQTNQKYRSLLVGRAASRLPVTAEGLPIGFYRVDLLPLDQGTPEEEVTHLRNAYVDLSFEHGYPTLPDGRPFWHKLDFEPSFAFGAFQMYLESLDDGPRTLDQLAHNSELLLLAGQIYNNGDNHGRTQVRKQTQTSAQAETNEAAVKRLGAYLQEFSGLYMWRARAKAYDLYQSAANRHLRMRRQGRIEDEHFTLATTLLASLKEKVLDTPKFFEDMAPKTAVELLAKLIGIQRISVGLPAAGPLALKETQEEQTFEMLIRSMGRAAANAAGGGGNTFDQNGGLVNQGKEMVNKILGDPENAAMLQEVVIRVTSASRNEKAKEGRDVTGGFQGRAFKSRGRTNEILSNEDLQPYDVTGAPGAGEDDG